MLTLLSPAKTLDFESKPITTKTSTSTLLERSEELIGIMRKQSPQDLTKLMRISPKLAELNLQRFKDWKRPFHLTNAKQAILAFKGDVYIGLEAEGLVAESVGLHLGAVEVLNCLNCVFHLLNH